MKQETCKKVYKTSISVSEQRGAMKRHATMKNSGSYRVSVLIALFMLFSQYFSFIEYKVWAGPLMILLTGLVDLYVFYRICVDTETVSKKTLAMVVLFCLTIGISYIMNASGVHRLLILLLFLLSIYLFVRAPLSYKEVKKLFNLFILIVICILLNTATGHENSNELHKFNPNFGGFLLTIVYCVAILLAHNEKSKRIKNIYRVIVAISFGLQFVFISRTAMLGIILFTVLYIFFRAGKKSCKPKTAFILMLIISFMGLGVAYLYAEILFPIIGYGNITILGKDLFSGRQEIWDFTFDSIRENLWFGVGNHLNETYYQQGYYELVMNAHNQPLGLLAAFGLCPFILFYILLAHLVSLFYRVQKANRVFVIFMLTISVMSYFDIYFMSLYNITAIIIGIAISIGMSRIKGKTKLCR